MHRGSESICTAALPRPRSSPPPPPPMLFLFVVTPPLYFSLCEPPPLPVSLHLLVYCCHLTSPTDSTPDIWPLYELLLMMPSLMIRRGASVTAGCFVLFVIPVFGSSPHLLPPLPNFIFDQSRPAPQNIVFLFIGLSSRPCTATGLVFLHKTRIKKRCGH